jgi:two-component system, NarL family, nitrate/nitrite response regulator NarL
MTQKRLIKIAISSPSPIFRTGLRKLLSLNSALVVIGENSDLWVGANDSAKEQPDVALLDLTDFDLNFPYQKLAAQIIILCENKPETLNERFFEMGVSGIISKECSPTLLFKAIRKVYEGEFWFDRSSMAKTILKLIKEKKSFYANPEILKITALSLREKEVIALVGQGLKNKEIAERLFISENTVRHHLGSIFEKLNVTGRLELVIFALKHNLVNFD